MRKKILSILVLIIFIFTIFPTVESINLKIIKKEKNLTNENEYYGLLIAVGLYLNNPDQDRPSMLVKIEDLYDTLVQSNNWEKENILKITGKEATFKNIINGFLWLDKKEHVGDLSLVYITTHGLSPGFDLPPFDETDGTDEALVPYEGFDNELHLLWDDMLNFLLNRLESKGVCLIVDSCYSGGFNDHTKIKNTKIEVKKNLKIFKQGLLKELFSKNRIVLMSSEENKLSYGSHFSHYLIDGLNGNADDNLDQIITAEEAFYYAQPIIERLGWQNPTILDNYNGEFPIINNQIKKESENSKNLINYFIDKIRDRKLSFF